jgi:putative Holliday junction resolvase
MVILAIDYGDKRIGLAVSDPLGIAAHGLDTIEKKGDGAELDRIAEIVEERSVERIVVGLPLHMNGSEGEVARKVRGFVKSLKRRIPDVAVELLDERLTSARAHRALSCEGVSMKERKKRVDRMAAQFILQRYLQKVDSEE